MGQPACPSRPTDPVSSAPDTMSRYLVARQLEDLLRIQHESEEQELENARKESAAHREHLSLFNGIEIM